MGSMVFCDLPKLLKEHGVKPRGVVQVGAHIGEEVSAFMNAGFLELWLFEPNQDAADTIEARWPLSCSDVMVSRVAVGLDDIAPFYRSGKPQQFSTVPLVGKDIWSTSETVPMVRLDSLGLSGFNLLVIDTQGTELDVLQSAGDKLQQFDMLIIEVDEGDRYVGSDHRKLLEWLDNTPLKPVASYIHGHDPKVSDRVFVRK